MIKLLEDLMWSPDGCRTAIIPAGEYPEGELPKRAVEIAGFLGIVGGADNEGRDINTEPEPEAAPQPESEPDDKKRKK